MDEKDNPPLNAQPQPPEPPATAAEEAPKKAYKSPTLKRHGNLRLMTQLE